MLKTFVWSKLMYGCESWTIKEDSRQKLEAAEMFFYRKMQRIPWTARVTNEEVLRRVDEERTLIKEIRRRQLKFLGHILRAGELEKDCLLGRIEGRRARGAQRIKFLDSLRKGIRGGLTVAQMVTLAENRTGWRSMIDNVTRQSPR